MKAKITKEVVDGAKPAAADYWIWDTSLKGFGLRVTPAGAKTYWVQYRMGGRGSPTRRYSIGKHGSPWTPDKARSEAKDKLEEVRKGIDPAAADRAREAKRFTVAELADRYLDQHVEPKNKASTAKEFRRLVETIIKPRLGSLAAHSPWPTSAAAISRPCNTDSARLRGRRTLSWPWPGRCSASPSYGASGRTAQTPAG